MPRKKSYQNKKKKAKSETTKSKKSLNPRRKSNNDEHILNSHSEDSLDSDIDKYIPPNNTLDRSKDTHTAQSYIPTADTSFTTQTLVFFKVDEKFLEQCKRITDYFYNFPECSFSINEYEFMGDISETVVDVEDAKSIGDGNQDDHTSHIYQGYKRFWVHEKNVVYNPHIDNLLNYFESIKSRRLIRDKVANECKLKLQRLKALEDAINKKNHKRKRSDDKEENLNFKSKRTTRSTRRREGSASSDQDTNGESSPADLTDGVDDIDSLNELNNLASESFTSEASNSELNPIAEHETVTVMVMAKTMHTFSLPKDENYFQVIVGLAKYFECSPLNICLKTRCEENPTAIFWNTPISSISTSAFQMLEASKVTFSFQDGFPQEDIEWIDSRNEDIMTVQLQYFDFRRRLKLKIDKTWPFSRILGQVLKMRDKPGEEIELRFDGDKISDLTQSAGDLEIEEGMLIDVHPKFKILPADSVSEKSYICVTLD